MIQNKKFGLIVIIFIIIPNIIFWDSPLLEKRITGFYTTDYKNLFLFLLFIPILASFFLLYKNYTSQIHSRAWYILAGIFGLASILIFYTIYSLSHFGFQKDLSENRKSQKCWKRGDNLYRVRDANCRGGSGWEFGGIMEGGKKGKCVSPRLFK